LGEGGDRPGGIGEGGGKTTFGRDLRGRSADVQAGHRAARRQGFQTTNPEAFMQRRMQHDMRLAQLGQHL
jgi:hypothetical protein